MKKLAVLLIAFSMIFTISCSGSSKTAGSDNTAKTTASAPSAVSNNSSSAPANTAPQNKTAASTSNSLKSSAPAAKSTEKSSAPVKKQINVPDYFTLKITRDGGKSVILNKKIAMNGSKSAMYYLEKSANVEDNGGFIQAINGLRSVSEANLTSDEKSRGIMGIDWFIYLNNKKTGCGINDIYPKKGDILNLDYKAWTYKDMAQ